MDGLWNEFARLDMARQVGSGDLVRHYLGVGDEGHMGWMHHNDRVHIRQQLVVHPPCIGSHFDNDRVLGRQSLANLAFQVDHLHSLRTEHLVELFVHTDGDQVVLVDVHADELFGVWFFGRHDCILLVGFTWQALPGKRPGTSRF